MPPAPDPSDRAATVAGSIVLVGAALVLYGVGLIWPPAAIVLAGVGLIYVGRRWAP